MSFPHTLAHRRLQPELMDDPCLDSATHRLALRGLGRINFWSRSAEILWPSVLDLQRQLGRRLRVLDLACGGGDVIRRLAHKAHRHGCTVEFVGCDKSATAIEFARRSVSRSGLPVDFFEADVLEEDLPRGFDTVMTSLFLHHLTDEQASRLLGKMADATRGMVLVNDLRRSRIGLILAQVGTRLLCGSPIVHHDGPRSVEGAYTCGEVLQLAERAGLTGATLTRCWPQRFLLAWRKL